MSRTKKRGGTTSPIKKYVSFSGGAGVFKYYDKEEKENVELDNLEIIVLDVRASITGFNEGLGTGNTSNMVLDTTKEELKVVAYVDGKPKVLAEGLYQDIKPDLKSFGGKFTQNIICLADVGDGIEVINLQLSGSALGGWIDLTTEYPNETFYDYKITLNKDVLSVRDKGVSRPVTKEDEDALEKKRKKNPRASVVWFYTLKASAQDLTEEESELAIEEDNKLQTYFEKVTGITKEVTTDSPEPSAPEDDEGGEPDDLPF